MTPLQTQILLNVTFETQTKHDQTFKQSTAPLSIQQIRYCQKIYFLRQTLQYFNITVREHSGEHSIGPEIESQLLLKTTV